MNYVVSIGYCLVFYMIYCARVVESDSCAVNFQGASSVRLSAETMSLSIGNYSVDYTKHTFDLWMSPNQFVAEEQTVFQTGQVLNSDGTSWAVEFKIKLTIWQKGHSQPSSSVLYVDVWTMSHGDHVWSKTRHYIILAEDSYPWLHVVYSAADHDSIAINGKSRRLDQYTTTTQPEQQPLQYLSIGGQYKGVVADVKVWKAAPNTQVDIQSADCDSKLGENMLVYFPLNECQGESFFGYINGQGSCALVYGSFDTNSIWNQNSPAIDSCKSPLDKCSSATRMSEVAPTQNSKQSSYTVPLWLSPAIGYKAIVVLPVLVIGIIILVLRNRNNRGTIVEPLQV